MNTTIAMTALDILSPRFNRNMDMSELKKLAESGQASAQYELAVRYFDGKNTPKDIAQSVEWLKKAVAQNHVNSQLFLGGLYEAGNGVPMDTKEAASLYLKAALKESSQAQFNLGWLYESGSGVEKNLSEAYKWYTLSGVTAAITSISAKMTPEQIEAGKKAAQNWGKK
jgi:TPR repeat protein